MSAQRAVPAKSLYRVVDDRVGDLPDTLPLLSVSISRGVLRRDEITDKVARADDLGNYKVCSRQDVVINRMSAYQGALGISPVSGLVSPDYLVLRANPNVEPRFLSYTFRSTRFIGEITARLRGIGSTEQGNVRTPRINEDDLGLIPVCLPFYAMQIIIADYLDRETARIDNLLAAKRRMVELLEERIRLLAYAWTTKNGDVLPLRHLVCMVKTGATPPVEAFARLSDGAVPWYSPADVGEWLHLTESERTLKTDALEERRVPRFPAKSTLLVGIGATAGKIAFLDHVASGNQQMTCLVTGPRIVPRFLSWQLFARRDEIRAIAPFTTLPIINNEFIRSLSLIVPPIAKQAEIVGLLDDETTKMQALVDCIERQITLLKERRQALITAAVTGQLDIPESA